MEFPTVYDTFQSLTPEGGKNSLSVTDCWFEFLDWVKKRQYVDLGSGEHRPMAILEHVQELQDAMAHAVDCKKQELAKELELLAKKENNPNLVVAVTKWIGWRSHG